MTQDEIIELARQAGWEMDDSCVLEPEVIWYMGQGNLQTFAKLVTEKAVAEQGYRKCAEGQKTTQFCALLEQAVLAEREKLKNIAFFNLWYQEMDAAVLAEREACAKVADDFDPEMKMSNYGQIIANRIRARGQQ